MSILYKKQEDVKYRVTIKEVKGKKYIRKFYNVLFKVQRDIMRTTMDLVHRKELANY